MPYIGGYQILDCIGHGRRSTVHRALHMSTHVFVACKKIPKTQSLTAYNSLKQVDFPFLVQLFEIIEDSDFYYIFEELLESPISFSLEQITTIPEWLSKHYFCQLISTLDYIHNEAHMLHRNISVRSMYADKNMNLRLADFKDECEFPIPEPEYTEKSDIWCAGAALYNMLTGSFPSNPPSFTSLMKTPTIVDLLAQMLNPDPTERISIKGIQAHPWFVDYPLAAIMNSNYGLEYSWRSVFGKNTVNPTVIQNLMELGIPEAPVMQAVSNGEFDSYTASYRIIKCETRSKVMASISNGAIAPNSARGKKGGITQQKSTEVFHHQRTGSMQPKARNFPARGSFKKLPRDAHSLRE